ncbi:MAG: helix-turn-helix domain-containing protein [Proteobacteria bacterium]|nr:helix-turn-helix domain-containing protein [Pseudomonadota bacterium]MBS0465225.1 helix-turn-helix domain-containing protein [Pseudomonadota bacterium]
MRVQTPATPAKLADDLLIADSELAALLSVSTKTLANWRGKGEGPRFVKVGKRCVRYRQSDVAAFIERGSREVAA